MKMFIALFALALGACATSPKETDQHLLTSFKRDGIKLEWTCTKVAEEVAPCKKGRLQGIEVTGYATAYGNTEALRENAFVAAHDVALAKLARFLSVEVTTSRVQNTMAHNLEIARDQQGTVEDDDSKPAPGTDNRVVRDLTETITSHSQAILHGVYSKTETVVDGRTVAVVIRWDAESEQAIKTIQDRI